MNIQLIHGEFSTVEAIDLLSKLIQVKIQFHENKIAQGGSEEDIKFRESKIKHLQHEWHALRSSLNLREGNLHMEATVSMH